MNAMRTVYAAVLFGILSSACFAESHEIAITIDDLPFVGTNSQDEGNLRRSHERFMSIVQSLVDNQVPATGFVIAGAIGKGQWELLETFRQRGFSIGNHTYSHIDLNRTATQKYIDEIAKADKILTPIMTQPKYFRYPYLAEGKGEKKQEVQNFLAANQYVVAPVTIDSKDYRFNERLLHISWRVRNQSLNRIKEQYLAYIWKQTLRAEKSAKSPDSKQILLIHANLLNAHCLGDIIAMYKQHGYRFITLGEALANPATQAESTKPVSVSELPAAAKPVPQDNKKIESPAITQSYSTDSEAFEKLSSSSGWSSLREEDIW